LGYDKLPSTGKKHPFKQDHTLFETVLIITGWTVAQQRILATASAAMLAL
jgi:hypothetical protein